MIVGRYCLLRTRNNVKYNKILSDMVIMHYPTHNGFDQFCPHGEIHKHDDDAAVEFLLEMSGPFPVEDKVEYKLE